MAGASVTGAGCGGGRGSGYTGFTADFCPYPNAIVAHAFVPIPGAILEPLPAGTNFDPSGVSDIIVTDGPAIPPGYAPLRLALVTIERTNVTARTGDDGGFTFAGLAPARYELEIRAERHEPLRFTAGVCSYVDPGPDSGGGDDDRGSWGGGDDDDGSWGGGDDGGGSSDDDGASSSGGDDSDSSFNRRLGRRRRFVPTRATRGLQSNQKSLGPGRAAR